MTEEHLDFYDVGPFRKKWNRMGYDDDDYDDLTEALCDRPDAGAMIPGTGGVIKLRWPPPGGGGKRGGSRVIYFVRNTHHQIFLLDVYAKKRQANLTPKQKTELKSIVKQFKE